MNPFSTSCFRSFACGLVLGLGSSVLGQPASDSAGDAQTRTTIQITEVGCLRALLVLDRSALLAEPRVAQRLTEVDFRIFPSKKVAGSRFSSADAKKFGEAEKADLVIYATAEAREKTALEDFCLFEGEATVQMYNALTGELIATHTARATGPRSTDATEAVRSAIEHAVDEAARSAVQQSLAQAHRMLAHEAVIVNVFSEGALLEIMEYMGKMDGVYHVRRLSYDRRAHEARLEIIGSPHNETFWRAYLEKMPKAKVNFSLNPNFQLRQKYPNWFLPAGKP